MGAMIAPTSSSGLTPPWVRDADRQEYLPCEGPVDLCRLSGQSQPPESGPKPWQRNALLGLVGLGACLYVGGVAAEAVFPIKPEPAQVTLAERQDYSADCQAQMGQKLSTNSEQIERLARLAEKLGPFQSQPTEFTLVDNQKINAYSCGLGKIMIEERLASLLTDDELLYVMAHEQGHSELQHPEETISYLEQGKWRLNVPILNIDPRAGYYAFARGHELQADCYAARVAAALGIPPEVGARALHKTGRAAGSLGGGNTHPGHSAREDNLKTCS